MDCTSGTLTGALIGAGVALVVGGPIAYYVGLLLGRRQRFEDKRTEVIGQLLRYANVLQDAYLHWAYLNTEGADSRQVIADRQGERAKDAIKSLNDLKLYFYSNEASLAPSTSAKVKEFIEEAESIVKSYPPNLKDIDFPKTAKGQGATARMTVKLPGLMDGLISEFRKFQHPPPWWRFWR